MVADNVVDGTVDVVVDDVCAAIIVDSDIDV